MTLLRAIISDWLNLMTSTKILASAKTRDVRNILRAAGQK